jgi:hypothetical protein
MASTTPESNRVTSVHPMRAHSSSIQRSAWKGYSPNFAYSGFSEVRIERPCFRALTVVNERQARKLIRQPNVERWSS